MPNDRRESTTRRLQRATGTLAAAAMTRMEETLPWFRAMPADQRSWVGLVVQAGIAAFTGWYRDQQTPQAISADVFGTAPRELARAVSLRQTVDMVKVTIEVIEERIGELAASGDESALQVGLLRYSREIAFAAAQVYAAAAEARGAWDSRLEALVVDALLRGEREETDEVLRSRAAALGWQQGDSVVVVAGTAPAVDQAAIMDSIHRAGRQARLPVLVGVQGDRLILVLGGAVDPLAATRKLLPQFGDGPVVVGPSVPELLAAAGSAQAAISGYRAAAAWPDAPRPVAADDLLPERALDGDLEARRRLVEDIYMPLCSGGVTLLETLAAYLEQASSLEATARMLFVHPNTVRYRLRRVADITGYAPTQSRSAFTLQIALALGRLAKIDWTD